MENSKRTARANDIKRRSTMHSSDVPGAASDLYDETKKYANELYEEGVDKVNKAQEDVREYTDELLEKVRANPLSSVLIAAGVGFLISSFMRHSK